MRPWVRLTVAFWFVLAGNAYGEDRGPTTEQVVERTGGLQSVWDALLNRESGLRLRLEPAVVSSGKFNGSRIGWYRVGGAVEAGFAISDRVQVAFSPSFAYERLDVDGRDDFIVGRFGRDASISDFLDGSLSIGGNYRLEKGWGAEIVTSASVRQESGAAFADSVRVGGSLAATYRRGKWLRLRLGIGLGTDLGDRKLRVSPVYRIVVRPLPDWSLEMSGLSGSVVHDFTNKTAIELTGGVDSTQYKLERRSLPPQGLGDGVLQRRQARLQLGIIHRFRSWFRVGAEFGLVFREELTILDEDGTEVDERTDRSPSPIARLRFELRL